MTFDVQIAGVPGNENATAVFVAWLLNSYFEQPPSWGALSARFGTDGPGRGYGACGYFYDTGGAWDAATFRRPDDDAEMFDNWITDCKNIWPSLDKVPHACFPGGKKRAGSLPIRVQGLGPLDVSGRSRTWRHPPSARTAGAAAMTSQLLVSGCPTGVESEAREIAIWLSTSQFDPPNFEWTGLAFRMETDGPNRGYGGTGYFYDRTGEWRAARFRDDQRRAAAGEADIYNRWIVASSKALGRPWIKCLVQIVRTGDASRARFQFEFKDWDRWTFQGGRELGDILRPPELPAPSV